MLNSSDECNDELIKKRIYAVILDGRQTAADRREEWVTDKYGETSRQTQARPLQSHYTSGNGDKEIEAPQETAEAEGDLLVEDRVRDMIQQAEAAKARMFANTGKQLPPFVTSPTAIVDEGYIVVGAHLEDNMINKIKNGEYVNFGKLLPKDRITEEDGKMDMFIKNGRAFWMPVNNAVAINNFSK